ncbi:Rpn family recombination-promoting nuclease/putative transposase [Synechococcus sp. PCC 6312]|uniref:Rpn family recombination-promoting nuclease/putative transposase n=1 Tax=Synechococcus sp. (strain ATCC 27167 / PCC 6312) TaxID=195253 RepID=UPI00029EC7A7|nr:Rpn family recombination-promoting nuclease/putative transposase [Synechococcus sp. PCC 6312]AFY62203.1 hypothetical protein Syn6312_3155 [Synechococcus sp. PCC 6312]
MRRDSIYYQILQQFPTCLFELMGVAPNHAKNYQFISVTLKETAFELDGILLPSTDSEPSIVYFLEVQFQKDEQFYERFFSELFIHLYRYRTTLQDWQAAVIYPNRLAEQRDTSLYQALLQSGKVHRIYLDELGETDSLPLNLMKLTITSSDKAPTFARQLAQKAQAQPAIIELLTTIMVYKFTNLSRDEVREMLGFTRTELKNTRFYQEVKAEGVEEGRQEGELAILMRVLKRRFGPIPTTLESQIQSLSQAQLESLAEAIFDFNALADVQAWISTLK